MNSGSGAAQNDEEEEESVRTPEREKKYPHAANPKSGSPSLERGGRGRRQQQKLYVEAQGGGRDGRKEECLEKFSPLARVSPSTCVCSCVRSSMCQWSRREGTQQQQQGSGGGGENLAVRTGKCAAIRRSDVFPRERGEGVCVACVV